MDKPDRRTPAQLAKTRMSDFKLLVRDVTRTQRFKFYQKYKLSLRAYTTSHETHTASLDLQIRKLEKALITAQQMLDEVKKDKAEAEKAFEARKRVLRENLGVGREVMWERDWWESSDEEFDDLE